jgi:hypothetical protein
MVHVTHVDAGMRRGDFMSATPHRLSFSDESLLLRSELTPALAFLGR